MKSGDAELWPDEKWFLRGFGVGMRQLAGWSVMPELEHNYVESAETGSSLLEANEQLKKRAPAWGRGSRSTALTRWSQYLRTTGPQNL